MYELNCSSPVSMATDMVVLFRSLQQPTYPHPPDPQTPSPTTPLVSLSLQLIYLVLVFEHDWLPWELPDSVI